jgi:hypothetical protein
LRRGLLGSLMLLLLLLLLSAELLEPSDVAEPWVGGSGAGVDGCGALTGG